MSVAPFTQLVVVGSLAVGMGALSNSSRSGPTPSPGTTRPGAA
jgi:hypothetical protein